MAPSLQGWRRVRSEAKRPAARLIMACTSEIGQAAFVIGVITWPWWNDGCSAGSLFKPCGFSRPFVSSHITPVAPFALWDVMTYKFPGRSKYQRIIHDGGIDGEEAQERQTEAARFPKKGHGQRSAGGDARAPGGGGTISEPLLRAGDGGTSRAYGRDHVSSRFRRPQPEDDRLPVGRDWYRFDRSGRSRTVAGLGD